MPDLELVEYEESETSQRILKIDWTDVSNIPDEVLSLRRMSWYLESWNGKDLARILEGLTIFNEVPLACKGNTCRFAKTCPLVKAGTVSRWENDNLSCPVEIVEAFKHFSSYINNLNVLPSDYTSVQLINDLVRLLIQMRRCDLLIREEDPVEIMVMGINPSTRAPIESRKPNELLVVQERLRKDINTAYSKLLASREAQLKERQLIKNNQDVTTVMSDIVSRSMLNKRSDPEDFQPL
jgi:hypothetical protein